MSTPQDRVRRSRGLFNRIAALVWAVGGMGSLAFAATYNLYFNNTEQGDNSTATPSVTIQQDANGKLVDAKKDPGVSQTPVTEPQTPEAVPPAEPAPVAAPAPAPVATSVATTPAPESRENKWRFGVMAMWAKERDVYSNEYDMYRSDGSSYVESYMLDRETPALGLSLAYSPLSYLGFNFFAGAGEFPLWGAELEVTPIKINLFGFQDAFELGFMAGGTSLARAHGNAVSLHAGLRAGWNFGERWQISASARGNLGFLAGDAGLSYKF